jgi:hypothetical protein
VKSTGDLGETRSISNTLRQGSWNCYNDGLPSLVTIAKTEVQRKKGNNSIHLSIEELVSDGNNVDFL